MTIDTASTIWFSGHPWSIKTSVGPVGPGPNVFSAGNVELDSAGRLLLRITASASEWTCAEVVGIGEYGYGVYRWTLASAVDRWDPAVVLGMFTWSDAPAQANRELDIEFSRWGEPHNPVSGGFTIQTPAGPIEHRFEPATGSSEHTLVWLPGRALFRSRFGTVERHWVYEGPEVPSPGEDVAPRMNLWLFRGVPPEKPLELAIESFSYTPGQDAWTLPVISGYRGPGTRSGR